jgi:beta-glucuronidase
MRHINGFSARALALVCASAFAATSPDEGWAAPPSCRTSIEIAGDWHFQMDAPDIGEKENWHAPNFDRSKWAKAEVPRAWDLFNEAMWGYEGVGWYSTQIAGSLARKDKVQRLRFGRVNYHAKVWLNGELVGENLNGYLPFEFDVSDKLKSEAPNQLVVRVDNTGRVKWLPGAKKIEWMLYGGILEPVTLETLPRLFISDLTTHAVPSGKGASVDCDIEIASLASVPEEITLSAKIDGAPDPAVTAKVRIAAVTKVKRRFAMSLAKADPWSTASPTLYRLIATIESDRLLDKLTTRFGIRKIETHGRDILINGQRLFAKGVNRYDEYGRFGPRPPRALLISDLQHMKEAGVNIVRVHYPQAPEVLDLYDEMGFMLIEEVPINWWGNDFSGKGDEVLDESILRQAVPALERMIHRDKNHPCLIIWSMANESQTATPTGIAVMRKLIRKAKELDKSRLVTFVISTQDAKRHQAFEEADLIGINVYQGVFEPPIALHASDLENSVTKASEAYIRRQLASFPDKPVLITEYGVKGVPGLRGDTADTEDFQAALNEAAWKAIRNCKGASGGILWCWADYYHRRTFNDNGPFGCFGVVTADRHSKVALAALTRMYAEKAH